MARPRKALTDKLTTKINFATTVMLKDAAEAAAKDRGVSLSSFVNSALGQYIHPEERLKVQRSYRRAEVLDALRKSSIALEALSLAPRAYGAGFGRLEVQLHLLRIERMLLAAAQGRTAAAADADRPSEVEIDFAGDQE